MNSPAPEHISDAKPLSTSTLKIIAIIAMVCDHAPYLFEDARAVYYDFPVFLAHAVGRITAPIFFYLLALGYRRTRDANRYTIRLLAFALFTYVPYIWYFYEKPDSQNFLKLNVIFTMLVGLLLLRAVNEVRNTALKAVFVVLCLLCGYWCDYGLYGLALILVCDITRSGRRGTILGMGAVIMTFAYVRLSGLFGSDMSPLDYIPYIAGNTRAPGILIVLLCQLLPLIFIASHKRWSPDPAEPKPGLWAKWGFYIFYPAHISVLLIIKQIYPFM